MKKILKPLGRYFLLDEIAQGGMATVFRARFSSKEQSSRILAIKTLRPDDGNLSDLMKLFRAEAQCLMNMNHPGIVQLYDFGEEAGYPYIAMELISGKSLAQWSTKLHESRQTLPVALAIHVTSQVAAALHYAHEFVDPISGIPLKMIHRDITPQNILISYSGHVKLIDFGVAKTIYKTDTTRTGLIRGKAAYLSPEQVSGLSFDHRTDIFSLGIIFWELLTGRRLFHNDDQAAILKKIDQAAIDPPSSLNSMIPRALDEIVMKALTRSPAKRYQTAEEFRTALSSFMTRCSPYFEPNSLTSMGKTLFSDEIEKEQENLRQLNLEANQLLGAPTEVRPQPQIKEESKDQLTATVILPPDYALTVHEAEIPEIDTPLLAVSSPAASALAISDISRVVLERDPDATQIGEFVESTPRKRLPPEPVSVVDSDVNSEDVVEYIPDKTHKPNPYAPNDLGFAALKQQAGASGILNEIKKEDIKTYAFQLETFTNLQAPKNLLRLHKPNVSPLQSKVPAPKQIDPRHLDAPEFETPEPPRFNWNRVVIAMVILLAAAFAWMHFETQNDPARNVASETK